MKGSREAYCNGQANKKTKKVFTFSLGLSNCDVRAMVTARVVSIEAGSEDTI